MSATPPRLSIAEKIASSRGGSWFIMNVQAKVDPWLLKRTDGRFSSLPGQPVLLLQHTGAKSGTARETPLVYVRDGDDIILVASAGGAPKHPAWYHNLVAHPDCHVIVKGATGDYVARELDGDDYEAMWAKAVDVYGGYDVYQQRTEGRRIPLLRLTPT